MLTWEQGVEYRRGLFENGGKACSKSLPVLPFKPEGVHAIPRQEGRSAGEAAHSPADLVKRVVCEALGTDGAEIELSGSWLHCPAPRGCEKQLARMFAALKASLSVVCESVMFVGMGVF